MMAYFDQSARASYAPGTGVVSRINAAVQRYRVMRRTYAELSSLSNRELDDLGISRADIPDIARRSAGYAN
jgi:uncharacterized protein YjiS (DUF1127 family)